MLEITVSEFGDSSISGLLSLFCFFGRFATRHAKKRPQMANAANQAFSRVDAFQVHMTGFVFLIVAFSQRVKKATLCAGHSDYAAWIASELTAHLATQSSGP